MLGCRVNADGSLGPAALRRVRVGAKAFRELGALAVVASGGKRWGGTAEADAFRARLVGEGVPAERVIRELLSRSTVENAHYAGEILRAQGLTLVAIVTCDWHLPRALAAFEREGVRAIGVPAPAPALSRGRARIRSASERVKAWLDERAFERRPRW